ncbi:MAG: phage tail assembly chaperone, partial [Terricaulis sp.]
MLAAAGALGVPPNQFWRLSLREWRAIAAPRTSGDPLQRAAFDRLALQ